MSVVCAPGSNSNSLLKGAKAWVPPDITDLFGLAKGGNKQEPTLEPKRGPPTKQPSDKKFFEVPTIKPRGNELARHTPKQRHDGASSNPSGNPQSKPSNNRIDSLQKHPVLPKIELKGIQKVSASPEMAPPRLKAPPRGISRRPNLRPIGKELADEYYDNNVEPIGGLRKPVSRKASMGHNNPIKGHKKIEITRAPYVPLQNEGITMGGNFPTEATRTQLSSSRDKTEDNYRHPHRAIGTPRGSSEGRRLPAPTPLKPSSDPRAEVRIPPTRETHQRIMEPTNPSFRKPSISRNDPKRKMIRHRVGAPVEIRPTRPPPSSEAGPTKEPWWWQFTAKTKKPTVDVFAPTEPLVTPVTESPSQRGDWLRPEPGRDDPPTPSTSSRNLPSSHPGMRDTRDRKDPSRHPGKSSSHSLPPIITDYTQHDVVHRDSKREHLRDYDTDYTDINDAYTDDHDDYTYNSDEYTDDHDDYTYNSDEYIDNHDDYTDTNDENLNEHDDYTDDSDKYTDIHDEYTHNKDTYTESDENDDYPFPLDFDEYHGKESDTEYPGPTKPHTFNDESLDDDAYDYDPIPLHTEEKVKHTRAPFITALDPVPLDAQTKLLGSKHNKIPFRTALDPIALHEDKDPSRNIPFLRPLKPIPLDEDTRRRENIDGDDDEYYEDYYYEDEGGSRNEDENIYEEKGVIHDRHDQYYRESGRKRKKPSKDANDGDREEISITISDEKTLRKFLDTNLGGKGGEWVDLRTEDERKVDKIDKLRKKHRVNDNWGRFDDGAGEEKHSNQGNHDNQGEMGGEKKEGDKEDTGPVTTDKHRPDRRETGNGTHISLPVISSSRLQVFYRYSTGALNTRILLLLLLSGYYMYM